MTNKIFNIIRNYVTNIYKGLFYPNYLKLYYFNKINNFGDYLNVYLIEHLTDSKVININPKYFPFKNFLVVGSILQKANKDSIIWGSGYISENSKFIQKPKKVLAVRGPLTRNKLLEQGVDCPEVYGDPALLLPSLYQPNLEKKYKYGVVPHFVDKEHPWVEKVENLEDVKILDIQTHDIEGFIDELYECENILSSSLHGVILADAYKIPHLWVKFSDKVLGDGFKFRDYYLSTGKNIQNAFHIAADLDIQTLDSKIKYVENQINLDKLISSAPFQLYKQHKQKENV